MAAFYSGRPELSGARGGVNGSGEGRLKLLSKPTRLYGCHMTNAWMQLAATTTVKALRGFTPRSGAERKCTSSYTKRIKTRAAMPAVDPSPPWPKRSRLTQAHG